MIQKFRDCCVQENYIWYIHTYVNALMRYNIQSEKTEFVDILPINYANGENSLFCRIIYINDVLYFIPNQNRNILMYKIEEHRFIWINSQDDLQLPLYGLFRDGYMVDNNIICIPSAYPDLIELKTDKNSIEKLLEWRKLDDKYKDAWIGDWTKTDNGIALLVQPFGEIILFSLHDRKSNVIMFDEESKFSTLGCIDRNLYIRDTKQRSIWQLNIDTLEKCQCLDRFCEDYLIHNMGCHMMLDDIFSGENYIVDKDWNLIHKYKTCNDKIQEGYAYFNMSDDMRYQGCWLYYDNTSQNLLMYNEMGKLVNIKKIIYNNSYPQLTRLINECDNLLREDRIIGLDDLIKSLI